MRIIVSDTSCLVDLRQVEFIASIFDLPFKFVIPALLFDNELLTFSTQEKQLMQKLGLELMDLDEEAMTYAFRHKEETPALSAYDCLTLALAQTIENAILMTGDSSLRRESEQLKIETRGVIWMLDQLLKFDCYSKQEAINALMVWLADPLVFLPEAELKRRILKLS